MPATQVESIGANVLASASREQVGRAPACISSCCSRPAPQPAPLLCGTISVLPCWKQGGRGHGGGHMRSRRSAGAPVPATHAACELHEDGSWPLRWRLRRARAARAVRADGVQRGRGEDGRARGAGGARGRGGQPQVPGVGGRGRGRQDARGHQDGQGQPADRAAGGAQRARPPPGGSVGAGCVHAVHASSRVLLDGHPATCLAPPQVFSTGADWPRSLGVVSP